jgi:hypothetical protein
MYYICYNSNNMSIKFTGEFPSNEQFQGTGRGKVLLDGDTVRGIIQGYQVFPWAMLVPSAEGFARDAGIRSTDVAILSERAGEQGIDGFYRAATGLPVVQHNGYVVELSGTGSVADFAPAEDPVGSIRAVDSETQSAVAAALAPNHTPQQLIGLAQALLTQAAIQA